MKESLIVSQKVEKVVCNTYKSFFSHVVSTLLENIKNETFIWCLKSRRNISPCLESNRWNLFYSMKTERRRLHAIPGFVTCSWSNGWRPNLQLKFQKSFKTPQNVLQSFYDFFTTFRELCLRLQILNFQITWRSVDSTAFPLLLNVIDEILLIWVFSVVENEVPQAVSRLVLYPSFVLEDES